MESIALVTEFSLFLYYQGLGTQLQTITMEELLTNGFQIAQ